MVRGGGILATHQAITGMVVAAKRERLLPLAVGSGSHLSKTRVRPLLGGGDRQDKQGVPPRACKRPFDLECFNFLVISVAQ